MTWTYKVQGVESGSGELVEFSLDQAIPGNVLATNRLTRHPVSNDTFVIVHGDMWKCDLEIGASSNPVK